MRYISWATFYEGGSDALYLDILIPRVIRDLVAREGNQLVEIPDVSVVKLGLSSRDVEKVAQEACKFRDAFDIIFIHADTGGRNVEQKLAERSVAYCFAMESICNWPCERCVTVTPRHETEAWLLADAEAVATTLGYTGDLTEMGLPDNAHAAERLTDPKTTLQRAVEKIAGRRRSLNIDILFPAIAQRQRLEILRGSKSFILFEDRLRRCLQSMRCIDN